MVKITTMIQQDSELRTLQGAVVILFFWHYASAECLRMLPYLTRWHALYSSLGLKIVGIHSPLFRFQPYIVLLNAFGAHAGTYEGEGDYARIESRIHGLLQETSRAPMHLPSIPLYRTGDPKARHAVCYHATPTIFLRHSPIIDADGIYHDIRHHVLNQWHLQGQWDLAPDYIQHARDTHTYTDYLALRYNAFHVNIVADRVGRKPHTVRITLDNKPLTLQNRGNDVELRNGHSYVTIDRPRLYNLVANTIFHVGELRIYVDTKDVRFYALSFSGCAGTQV
ncbi:MAG: Alkyl hydroperoxide reductase/ Thiol specific antioxidant/ Mal allergen [Parcubacteria group bacterium GW2011_GWA2_47_8]|nr:MAG: Alkyl hydroperoxide reductase/ Thiol specific antioxidant/ Mal allergen [Parcubacteria group bacterium GW2011_GWA2_47_8]